MSLRKISTVEKFQRYLLQDDASLLPHDERIVLSPEEDVLLEMYDTIYGKLIDASKRLTQGEAAKWAQEEFQISRMSAIRMVKNAMTVFGEMELKPKKVQRSLESVRLEKMIAALQYDFQSGNLETVEYYDLHLRFTKRLHAINDLDRPEVIDPEEMKKLLQVEPVEFSVDPEVLKDLEEGVDFEVLEEEEDIDEGALS